MKRRQLLEIHEQTWCPAVIRDGATDVLRVIAGWGRQYQPALPLLANALQASGSRTVVDLCSGGGGPWFSLVEPLAQQVGQPVTVLLTDLYPNSHVSQHPPAAMPQLRQVTQPVDVTRVPESLAGFRTLFTAFHHFPPLQAQAILEDAVRQGQGIAIFEQTRRHPVALLLMLGLPFIAWLATPFLRPFQWRRLLFTYLLPLIPLVLCVDGLVSCLRTYSPAELRAMTAGLEDAEYVWQTGRVSTPLLPIGVIYLIGYPKFGYRCSDNDFETEGQIGSICVSKTFSGKL